MSALKVGDTVEVTGFVMLQKMEPGKYRVANVTLYYGSEVYSFTKPKGKKVIVRHRAANVDAWIREANDPDLNKIVKI